MSNYKYFSNVKAHAVFTEKPCQFCASEKECLEGVYFEQTDIESVCLECLELKKASAFVPPYVSRQIKHNEQEKTAVLMQTPPVPWVQYNDWPACCDDYMQYIGEWEREDFDTAAEDGKGAGLLREMMREDQRNQIDDPESLWNSLGDETIAFVFRCCECGKRKVVCQSY